MQKIYFPSWLKDGVTASLSSQQGSSSALFTLRCVSTQRMVVSHAGSLSQPVNTARLIPSSCLGRPTAIVRGERGPLKLKILWLKGRASPTGPIPHFLMRKLRLLTVKGDFGVGSEIRTRVSRLPSPCFIQD